MDAPPPPSAGKPSLGGALRALREAAGVTQAGWAAHLGYGRSTVQRWEQGEAVPDAAAEAAIRAACEAKGLYHRYDRGPLAGVVVTPDWLHRLLAEARLAGGGDADRAAPSPTSVGPGPPVAAPAPVRVAPGTFVGRTGEVDRLRNALASAVAGEGRLVLLAGEPGIGKTRLAQELSAEAQSRGCLVLWGRCWEGEGAPAFWPWVEALGAYARAREPSTLRAQFADAASDIAQVVPQVRALLPDLPAPPASDPEQARYRLFDGVTAFLGRVAAAEPLLLVLDDLHWADKPSLLLLQFVTRHLAAMRLLLIGSYRDTDLDRRHPLAELLPALRREPVDERLSLRGLSAAEVERLLASRAGHELDEGGRWRRRCTRRRRATRCSSWRRCATSRRPAATRRRTAGG
jgi:transcriptional regulator with XRE-family HTH domain